MHLFVALSLTLSLSLGPTKPNRTAHNNSRHIPPLNPYYSTLRNMPTLPLGMPSLPNISTMQTHQSAYAMQPNAWGTLHWA